MLRRRLDTELHGSAGYTSVLRIAVLATVAGFFVLGTQLALQGWFAGRMMPGVAVAGRDLSGLSMADARAVLRNQVQGYHLSLDVAGQKYSLSAADLGVTFDTEATVETAYRSGRGGWWPTLAREPLSMSYQLDRAQLNAFATSVADKVGTPPVDAGVVVKGANLSVTPEKSGWSVDRLGLERMIEGDVAAPGNMPLTLKAHERLADIQSKALTPVLANAKQQMATPIILTIADKNFTPSPADIGQWLSFVKQTDGTGYKLIPQVDIARLRGYVQTVANSVDVSPVNKKVTIENGVSRVDQEGVDGAAVDRDPLTAAMADAVAKQTPLTYTITTHPVPFKTVSTSIVSLDMGRYIEVNLSSQHLWVWQDHNVIFDSPLTSGATGAHLGTVTGLFSIYYKTTNTHLVGYQYGYNYDVFVKYWMPFYQGFGLHDASWRNGNFGGQDYYYGGSHGCVNLPEATAAFLYNWADVGTPVWVHN